MNVSSLRWTALLAALLLLSSPAFAQDTDDEPETVEEVEAIEDDEADDEASEAEENVEEDVDEVIDEIEEEAEPTPPVAPPVTAPPAPEPPATPDTDEADESDEDFAEDDPMRGAMIAPAREAQERGVRIRGNLDDGDRWTLDLGGFIGARYSLSQNDPSVELFGRNDGFRINDARLILRGNMDNGLGAVFSLDAGSRLIRTAPDSPVDELAARMADTYISYRPFQHLEILAGQFKAPFDIEELISTTDLLFISRSVANRGVQNVEGYNVPGLSQGRQIGLQVRGSYFPLADENQVDGPGISFASAVTNGNGANVSLNNNDRYALYQRLSLHWGEMVSLGGAVFHNDTTLGDPPNQVNQVHQGWTADLLVSAYGATLIGSAISRSSTTAELEDSELTEMGYQVQIGYQEPFFGFQAAYRFATLDPTFEHAQTDDPALAEFFENDSRIHHTLGLNYNATGYPIRLMTNYTITMDEEAVAIDNNRLDVLLQLQW